MLEENLTEQIIGAAIDVHRYWGPGLYEEIYEKSLCRELDLREIKFQNQLSIPLIYKDFKVGDDLKVDVFVANKVESLKDDGKPHDYAVLGASRLSEFGVGFNQVELDCRNIPKGGEIGLYWIDAEGIEAPYL